jgi:putative Mn2+ efflux pump MntP
MTTLLLLGFVLSLDSFRVSLSLGTLKLRPLRQVQIVIAFALCDGLAPLVGLLIGQSFVKHIGAWVEPLGPLMLFVYGVYVIYSARRCAEKETEDGGPWLVLGLPLSLSLDNLIAGASLGLIGFPLLISVAVIGSISGLMSLAGLRLGNVAANYLRIKTDLIGGIALICIAVALAIENFR